MMEWSKPICTMPEISTLDNIPPHQILKDGRGGKKKKKIDVNARRFTRGFKDWETVTHYLSKCQWNVKGLQSALSTSGTTQMLLRASLLPFHLMGKHVGLVRGRMHSNCDTGGRVPTIYVNFSAPLFCCIWMQMCAWSIRLLSSHIRRSQNNSLLSKDAAGALRYC